MSGLGDPSGTRLVRCVWLTETELEDICLGNPKSLDALCDAWEEAPADPVAAATAEIEAKQIALHKGQSYSTRLLGLEMCRALGGVPANPANEDHE